MIHIPSTLSMKNMANYVVSTEKKTDIKIITGVTLIKFKGFQIIIILYLKACRVKHFLFFCN